MYDLKPNLEPGNPDGHTVLRYLVETKQLPIDAAIERVYQAVSKFAQEYRSDQNKLMTGMIVSGVFGLPILFPFGVPSLLIAGAIAGSVFRWQELGSMRDRLKPEYSVLKGSVLLEQFIKWLATSLRERREQAASTGQFQPDALTPANIIAAYEHTVEAVMNGEHLDNNASDPILALFVLKLRQHTNHLPNWVIDAFRQLEQAEGERALDVAKASLYMWGNLEERYPHRVNSNPQIGQNTRTCAVEVPAQPVQGEGEQGLGKPIPINPEIIPSPSVLSAPTFNQTFAKAKPVPVDIALQMAQVPKSTIVAASPRVGKGVVVTMAIGHLTSLHPDLEIWLLDPKDEPTERHYWALIDPDKRCHFDLRPFDLNIEEAIILFEKFLIRFNQSSSHRKLLIIDEFVMLNQKCAGSFMNRVKDFIVGICSSGETSPDQGIGRFVWVITQSPYVTDIGFKTKAALTTFQRVFLLNMASLQLYSLAASASFVPSGLEKEVEALLEITGRAFYYSRTNSWHPVPSYELPNVTATLPKPSTDDIEIIQPEKTHESTVEPENKALKISDDLAEPLKTIWLFCKERSDWVTAKEMYQASKSALKGKSVKQIRQLFGLLADSGYGEVDEMDGGKAKSDSASAFRAY